MNINDNFFKKWNPEMAYILGFVVADGSVSIRQDRIDSYYFNITNKDKKHLENIRDIVLPSQNIGSKCNGSSKEKKYHYIQTTNKQICKDLINLGIVPQKTYNLGPIKVPNKYFADFARGFFDGDGSVYIQPVNGTPQIKVCFVCASSSFITEFNKQLCKNINIPQKNIHKQISKIKNKVPIYSIDLYIDDCERLARFMYKNNPTLYLPRKYKIFEKWKTIKRRKYIKKNYPSKIG